MKKKIAIISSSVRNGRLSHRVALFFRDYLIKHEQVEIDLIDLLEYDFPIFHERLPYLENPSADLLDYARRITEADGIVVVSPVYNASYPAALKNAVDVLMREWRSKPVMVASVSSGSTAGITTAMLVQSLLIRLGARVASPVCTMINTEANFSPEGTPSDPESTERFAKTSVDEFMWLVEKSSGDKK